LDLFAHRIHKASYVNGIVRLECSILHPDASGQYHPDAPVPPQDVTFTVNMPLQGFLRSVASMRDLVNKLQEDGILNKSGGAEGQEPQQAKRGQRALRDLSEDERRGDNDQIV
jgi:hypothetical protein